MYGSYIADEGLLPKTVARGGCVEKRSMYAFLHEASHVVPLSCFSAGHSRSVIEGLLSTKLLLLHLNQAPLESRYKQVCYHSIERRHAVSCPSFRLDFLARYAFPCGVWPDVWPLR